MAENVGRRARRSTLVAAIDGDFHMPITCHKPPTEEIAFANGCWGQAPQTAGRAVRLHGLLNARECQLLKFFNRL